MIPRRFIHTFSGEAALLVRAFCGGAKNAGPRDSAEWEKTFAAYVGCRHAAVVPSGRRGMEMLLRAFGFSPGDEVLVPAYTLGALLDVVRAAGLRPVACDVEPESFNIDPRAVVSAIGSRTRAVVATHLFGAPCRIEEIMRIARERNLKVIEDCAHSAGARYLGRSPGSFGDAAFFSFETIKPLNTYGGGMALVREDGETAARLRAQAGAGKDAAPGPAAGKVLGAWLEKLLLRTPLAAAPLFLLAHPKTSAALYRFYRGTQKTSVQTGAYSALQSRLGLEKLKTLDARARERREKAAFLTALLPPGVRPQAVLSGAEPNYYFYVARLPGRAGQVRLELLKRGIDAGIGAEIADDCAAALGQKDCPETVRLAGSLIHLPLHEGTEEKHLRRVAQALARAC